MPPDAHGVVRKSEARIYLTTTPTQRRFVERLLSTDIAQIENLRLTETRDANPSPCEIEVAASLRTSENLYQFRTIECNKDGCAVTFPKPAASK